TLAAEVARDRRARQELLQQPRDEEAEQDVQRALVEDARRLGHEGNDDLGHGLTSAESAAIIAGGRSASAFASGARTERDDRHAGDRPRGADAVPAIGLLAVDEPEPQHGDGDGDTAIRGI